MSETTTDQTTEVCVARGPAMNAAIRLANASTLAQHVQITATDRGVRIYHTDQFGTWGTGTQGLWRILESIADEGHAVDLYRTIAHLDPMNRLAVADAISTLCGGY